MNSPTKRPVLLSWSSGKDSSWALSVLRADPTIEVRGLLTSCNAKHERVAMHGVRRELLEAQADALGLPLRVVDLPHPCTNDDYEASMGAGLQAAKDEGVDAVAFGDLFLEDVRTFREQQLAPFELEPLFPIWGRDTHDLAQEMVNAGLRAIITCLDPRRCPRELAGAVYDASFLERLPRDVDPCGENGEFHSFCYDGPIFDEPINVRSGEVVERENFVFVDLLPT